MGMGMGWVWGLKFNPHGSPDHRTLTVLCMNYFYCRSRNEGLFKVILAHISSCFIDKAISQSTVLVM